MCVGGCGERLAGTTTLDAHAPLRVRHRRPHVYKKLHGSFTFQANASEQRQCEALSCFQTLSSQSCSNARNKQKDAALMRSTRERHTTLTGAWRTVLYHPRSGLRLQSQRGRGRSVSDLSLSRAQSIARLGSSSPSSRKRTLRPCKRNATPIASPNVRGATAERGRGQSLSHVPVARDDAPGGGARQPSSGVAPSKNSLAACATSCALAVRKLKCVPSTLCRIARGCSCSACCATPLCRLVPALAAT